MQLTAQIRYDAAPPVVYAMLVDRAFQEQVLAATGAISHSAAVEEAGEGATITTTRELSTDQFPDFVKKFVGATVHVMRVDHWGPPGADGARQGTVVVEIKGAPVRLTGTLSMRADGTGTIEDVDGDLKASVPLLGGKVEKAVEPPLRAAISKEQEIGTRWLAG